MDLHYKSYGSGEVIVILHGLFGMSDNWKTIATRLSDDYQVILPDLPNHGRSPRLTSFTLENVAEALFDFLNEHQFGKIRLVGHSLGAKVAMRFAMNYPDRLHQLVSVDMGPREYQPGHQEIFKALRELDIENIENRRDADDGLQKLISNQGTRLFLLKNLKRSESGFEWKFDLPTLYRDYENILIPITSDTPFQRPTLFIAGGDSNYLNFGTDMEFINQLFSDATAETIPDAGHWVHADKPREFELALRSFII